jgi:hypothetical protein
MIGVYPFFRLSIRAMRDRLGTTTSDKQLGWVERRLLIITIALGEYRPRL